MSALLLKLLAALAMLCDHTAIAFYPLWLGKGAYLVLRGIGRIAFPIFAYFITVGYEKTSSLPRYLTRLCSLALLSQLPYSLVFVSGVYSPDGPTMFSSRFPWPVVLLLIIFVAAVWLGTVRRDGSVVFPVLALFAGVIRLQVRGVILFSAELNVFYTLALGLACVSILDRALKPERELPALLLQTAAVAACFFLIRGSADYRYLGVALIICFYLGRDQRLSQLLLLGMWAVIEYLVGRVGWPYFLCACVSAVLLYFYNGERGRSLGRFFYWLYPAHLAVLGILRLLLVS